MEITDEKIVIEYRMTGLDADRSLVLSFADVGLRERFRRMIVPGILTFLVLIGGIVFSGKLSAFSVILAAVAALGFSWIFGITMFLKAVGLAGLFEEAVLRREKLNLPSTRVTLDQLGLRREDVTGIQMTNWEDISDAFETEGDIFLSHTDPYSYQFPKSVFTDFDQLYLFKKFVRHQIGERARF